MGLDHSYEDLHKLTNLRGKMQQLYSNLALRTFAFSCVSFFVPIYLLFFRGLSFESVALFFVVFFAVEALFSPLALVLSQRIGLKNTVVVSMPFSILFFVMLYRMGDELLLPLWLVALVGGAGEALYFTALNIDFALNTKKEYRGYNMGALDSFFKSSALFGPIFGALVIVYFGFELLFGLVLLVLMLCMIPALQVRVRREKFRIRFSRVFGVRNVRYLLAFFAYGVVSAAEWFLWPVFVFVVLSSGAMNVSCLMNVALAVALVGLGSAVFAGFFRLVSSRFSVSAFLKVGALLYAVTWVLRANSSVAIDVYALSFLSGLVIVLVHIPFFTDTIERAKERGVVEFIAFREFVVCAGRVAFFGVFFWALACGWPVFDIGFLAAAVASLLFLAV